MSPLVTCGCHHTHLALDLSQNAMGHQRGLSPKALLAIRVTVTTGRRWGVSQSDDWVSWVSVSVGCCQGGMSWGWRGSAGRRRGVALEKRVQFVTVRPNCGAFFLGLILSWVPALVLCLVVEQSDQEVDVLDSKTQDFILAELLVRRVCGNEFSQLRESPVHVLLSPALTAVCEDTPGNFLRRACKTQILWVCRAIKDVGSWYTLSLSTNPIKRKIWLFSSSHTWSWAAIYQPKILSKKRLSLPLIANQSGCVIYYMLCVMQHPPLMTNPWLNFLCSKLVEIWAGLQDSTASFQESCSYIKGPIKTIKKNKMVVSIVALGHGHFSLLWVNPACFVLLAVNTRINSVLIHRWK